MNKKLPQNIQQAVKKGELIPYEEIWRGYSCKDRAVILEKARYLKVAKM